MNRVCVTFVLTVFAMCGNTSAQQVPDNDAILRAIIDSDSQFYYPSLIIRYEVGDTTLTQSDYHHLYYGFAYQDAYKPLEAIAGESELLSTLERTVEPTPEEAQQLIQHAKKIMESDPFSPKNINFMTYAYSILGDTVNERISADRLAKVLMTIELSGNGLKENTPRHVLWFSHASDYIASKGLEMLRRTVRTRSVEYIELKVKDEGVKGYFFDFGRVYWRKPELPPRERRVTGFEINGIKVGRPKGLYTPAR